MNMTHEPMPRKDYEKEYWERLFQHYEGREINQDQPTFVITHGFMSNGQVDDGEEGDWIKDMAESYRKENPNANIIVVNWKDAAALDQNAKSANIADMVFDESDIGEHDWIDVYEKAAHNTPEIGRQLGDYLVLQGVNPKNTELIGHSLGAHVSGAAGARYQEITGEKINTITALDPAGPGFQTNETLFEKYFLETDMVPHKLDSGDAENVVAIHSSVSLGYESDIGTTDIYLNDKQPNGINPVTAHGYAHQFFISLVKKDFYIQPNGTILNLESLKLKGSFNVDTRNAHIVHEKNPGLLEKLNIDKGKNNKVGEFRINRKSTSNQEKFDRMSESIPYDVILKYISAK